MRARAGQGGEQRGGAVAAGAARRRAEGKSIRDVRRCLKRAVARQVFKLLERHDQPAVEVVKVV
jgi:hypothetical protein